jgi:hypothetical protein
VQILKFESYKIDLNYALLYKLDDRKSINLLSHLCKLSPKLELRTLGGLCEERENQQDPTIKCFLSTSRRLPIEAVMGLFAGEALILPLEGLIIFVLHHQISP